jgi:hypothetical protein
VKHRYALNGEHAPGVTTFIKAGYPESFNLSNWKIGQGAEYVMKLLKRMGREKPLKIDDKVSEQLIKRAKKAYQKEAKEAAGIGSIVHDYAYLVELGRLHEATDMLKKHKDTDQWDKIINGVRKFESWYKENMDELINSEQIVASVEHSYAGKFDRLAKRDGIFILSDFKTSNGIYIDQFIQLAAYRLAIKEWLNINIGALEILRFGKEDGNFHTLLINDKEEIQTLTEQAIRCRQTYQFRKLENDKRFKFGGK